MGVLFTTAIPLNQVVNKIKWQLAWEAIKKDQEAAGKYLLAHVFRDRIKPVALHTYHVTYLDKQLPRPLRLTIFQMPISSIKKHTQYLFTLLPQGRVGVYRLKRIYHKKINQQVRWEQEKQIEQKWKEMEYFLMIRALQKQADITLYDKAVTSF